ncbi:thioredoxin-like protein [Gloeophyllum trabeum ATCC 11539]|uniref:Thioredoxin-like protein n=1 Tax=Gloeophyllum trabeum (strain ATCC 11539 / FP-39264 / Madison 617) TaxID=670483 RepID=S7QFR3_GLOTA|nr:thioredoxin-like protein [Gloeophyllum trabeum ATCC 11539]EPQ57988.1 thioredoxin-like protein [Gloeophyllum trabeum ATCC 11539]
MASALRLRSLALRPLQARAFHVTPRALEHFLDADKETFARVTSKEHTKDRVVLVDFYADWCGPCKQLSPLLEQLTSSPSLTSGSGRPVDLVTVDVDAEPELSMQYKVSSIPTVVAFKDGEKAGQFVGALPEPAIKKFLGGL